MGLIVAVSAMLHVVLRLSWRWRWREIGIVGICVVYYIHIHILSCFSMIEVS
jgi:hypothetical protein